MKYLRFIPFFRDSRATVALEGAMATSFLVFALTGVFEIVNTLLVGDLLNRAAYRVARASALADTAASSVAQLRTQCVEAVRAEVGDLLDFDLAASDGTCSPADGQDSSEFCLSITVSVYDNPSTMLAGTVSQGSNAALGGDAGEMVVVRMQLEPQTVLGRTQRRLLGNGRLTAMTVMRNDRVQEETS